jgi:hypothetical protein
MPCLVTTDDLAPWSVFAHDLEGDPQELANESYTAPGVTAISPHQHDRGHRHPSPGEHQSAAVAVLHAGCGDQHHHQQAQGVDHHVTLAAVDLLAGVEPAAGCRHGVCALD